MPDAAVYGPPSLDRALGSLPVIASFLDQLNVAGAIDELCPICDVALATHGQVIEAMIASRLTSPTPLVRVIDWACAWAVGHCFGIAPEVLNDDRLGRALDAIAPHLDQIAGTIGARAITQFGVDVSQIPREVLGDLAERFEEDLRRELYPSNPVGVLRQTIDFAYEMARRPTQSMT